MGSNLHLLKNWQTMCFITQKCPKNSGYAVKTHSENHFGHPEMTAFPESALSETALAEGWLYHGCICIVFYGCWYHFVVSKMFLAYIFIETEQIYISNMLNSNDIYQWIAIGCWCWHLIQDGAISRKINESLTYRLVMKYPRGAKTSPHIFLQT